jgi:uncharacterized membrane protein YgcG
MINRSLSVLITCACLLAAAGLLPALAADPQAARAVRPSSGGIVRGTVKDNTGAVIPNATVTLTDQNGATQTTQSQGDGSYTFRRVAPGAYTVSAEAKGLTQDGVVAVMAATGQPAQGNIVMKPQDLKEEVTVAETSTTQISVDPSQNAASLVLKKEDLAALPDDPDDLAQDLQALAGPSAGPGGGQVYIDGFSSGRFPPKESIREIRINQNPFSSEYDKLGFGRIEILTKPGSDKFHGTAFYTISDGAWNARNPFLTVTPDFRSQSFGGNVSGPVNKHASFFVDAERRQIDDNGILNAYILDPNNPGNVINDRGFTPTPQQRTTISPRLDWQLGTNNTLSMRYSYLDNHHDLWNVTGFNLPQNGYAFDNSEHTAQITDTQILSAKVVNETRFQYRKEAEGYDAVSDSPQLKVQGAFTGGGSTYTNTSMGTQRFELQNYTTVSQGKHSIRFGARLRDERLDYYTPTNFNGTFLFGCLLSTECGSAYAAGAPEQFTLNQGNPRIRVNQFDIGGFIQDDWRIASNFTLSTGLRYEYQTNMSDWRDFAPRVGFAWSPSLSGSTGRPKTVIRGGFGIFYMRFDDADVATADQNNGINQQNYLVKNPAFYPNIPAVSGLSLDPNHRIRYVFGNNLPDFQDHNLRAPYLIQSAIGVERQLFSRTTLAVNFTNTRGVHQFRTRDINAPLPGTGLRPYGDVGDLYLYESSGLLKQTQLLVRVNTQIGKRVSLFGAYIWNNAHTNTDGLTSLPVNQYNSNAEWGRSTLGIENRTFIGGSIRGPLRLQFSPFIIARSGIPFDITTGLDNNLDGIVNDRPGLASGPGPNIYSTPYGYLDSRPVVGETILPRNYGMGPNQVTINLRASRTWGFGTTKISGVVGGASAGGHGGRGGGGGGGRGGGFGGGGFGGGDSLTEHRYNLTLSVSARNLLNHPNYGTPIGIITSETAFQSIGITGGFGAEQTPTNNRRLDLQLRFQF